MTQRILRTLSALAGLFFFALGLFMLFAPARQSGQFAIFATGSAGLSTLRSDFAGLFLGMAVFILIGAIRASNNWLAVPAVFLSFIILGRFLNLILDGRSTEGLRALLVELIVIAILLLTIASLRSAPARSRYWLIFPALLILLLAAAFLYQRPLGLRLQKALVDRGLENQLLPTLPDALHAGLCGSGAPLPDPNRAGPCVFVIAGKRLYIVDAGEDSPRKMLLMGVAPGRIDAILLTHFHSDHIGALGELMLQRWAGASHQDQVPVIGPQGVESVVKGFNDAYALDKLYRVAHHGEAVLPPSGAGGITRPFNLDGSDTGQVVLNQDGLTITAFAVDHHPVFPAAGYRFDYKGRSVVVSGDTAPSPTLAKFARNADVLFHEGLQTSMVAVLHDAAARNGRAGAAKIMADIPSYHTTPEDAARIAQISGVRYLMFYHLIPPLPTAYLNAAFLGDAPKIFKGPITVGRDGILLTLLPGSATITLRELL